MADIDNMTEINENFDTVKTLLNSIRAQGILNTSDVDKILSGINAKLEKINTEEDIDLIKVFLSELKKNLDERHNILVSKFGAIESLFSNLLKNSNELTKSSELKELFDVVATNLSVFSREVVAQKESLTDIAMRLDAIRSDDSQKKDIIKNITLLKPDLERLNNGFDTIVLSLNDNFKTLAKTLSALDKTEYFDKFSGSLNNIEMSSNALLSAIQLLDKKTENSDELIKNLASKTDLEDTGRSIAELKLLNQGLNDSVNEINQHYSKIDNLADKIDASVSIIAGLKTVIEDSEDTHSKSILENLDNLSRQLNEINSDTEFEEFKTFLASELRSISENNSLLKDNLSSNTEKVIQLLDALRSLDISSSMSSVFTAIENGESKIQSLFDDKVEAFMSLSEANLSKIIDNIATSADSLNTKMNQTQAELSSICSGNFTAVFENIADLKKVVSQIDENGVSASNAMFSNISDRLNLFESALKESLDLQESTANNASTKLCEQVENIKNLSSVLDYKMDSSVVEISNMTRMFETVKNSIDSVLALNFTESVKDLRADIYASKQDLSIALQVAGKGVTEDLSKDIYGKYELIISRLETVEDEFKKIQATTLTYIKDVMEKISASLVDVLSYVSESKEFPMDNIDKRLENISEQVKETNLNYVENVRDIVELIRIQVENDLKELNDESLKKFDILNNNIDACAENLHNEIKNSYDKLVEIQNLYGELKSIAESNSEIYDLNADKMFKGVESIGSELDVKLASFKSAITDKITEFKNECACENASQTSEFKFTVENINNSNLKEIIGQIDALKSDFNKYTCDNDDTRTKALENIYSNFSEIKEILSIKSGENAEARTIALSKLIDSFEGLKTYLSDLSSKSSEDLLQKTNNIMEAFESVKAALKQIDDNVDKDITRQLSIIESNFESLISQITILNEKSEQSIIEKINSEYSNISEKLDNNIAQKLETYKTQIEDVFNDLSEKAKSQSIYLQERVSEISSVMKSVWEAQSENNMKQIDAVANNLKQILADNIESSAVDYTALKDRLDAFTDELNNNNDNLAQNLKAQMDDMTKYIDSVLDIQTQESDSHIDEFVKLIENLSDKNSFIESKLNDIGNVSAEADKNNISKLNDIINLINDKNYEFSTMLDGIKDSMNLHDCENKDSVSNLEALIQENSDRITQMAMKASAADLQAINEFSEKILAQLEIEKDAVYAIKELVPDIIQNELKLMSKDVEKETDSIIAELDEQFDDIKKSQQDMAVQITNGIESIVENQIYNNIEDLKSYLDIKTDSNDLIDKIDNLKIDITESFENVISDLNKMLQADVFASALSDYRAASEIIMSSAVDRINDKISSFVGNAMEQMSYLLGEESKSIENKLALFDKKFIETVVDKYEELKLISGKCNDYIDEVKKYVDASLANLSGIKGDIDNKIDSIIDAFNLSTDKTTAEIRKINDCFENLRSQISNKSFDEAFQESIGKQISALETLIDEQYDCIRNVNSICDKKLPGIDDLLSTVRNSVVDSLQNLVQKTDAIADEIESQDIEGLIENSFKNVKTDIITQFLNVFNQISFVAEQEEIIDFIQERHDELITVLSHIVTTTSDISDIKDDVCEIDNKINLVKDGISLLNDKITSIISSEGDVDYIYSLQDLESDIANLRVVLKDMHDNTAGYGDELDNLMTSTENVYKLVESIKEELPDKKSIENLTEDIVSISTRTNKLILASDESYKTLQDNLQEFKLVIDDLDERTRNFAQESGMDRIDSKLNALNTMVQNGTKTNQVFNQVFEYLAEWVDNAGNQISAISDKVEMLDDIGQIKVMLADMKANSEDNSDSVELVQALGDVFDKQAKKISAMETKLDKMIVANTISNEKNKIDLKPFEDTLNKFLVAMGEKVEIQQSKIDVLESKLEHVISVLGEKDTAQLTKKVGGMDKQIAKLNKSIEKIASHVVEK